MAVDLGHRFAQTKSESLVDGIYSGDRACGTSDLRPWLATSEFFDSCRRRNAPDKSNLDEKIPTMISEEPVASGEETPFRFMDLPAEIRMQIYRWVHLMHPVRRAQLAPWYPIPVYSDYIVVPLGKRRRLVQPADTCEEEEVAKDGEVQEERETFGQMLSPFRPLSCIPSNLLRAHSRIYFEARMVPFEHNEFVFVNWFASGLWAAKAFTDSLMPWQRAHLRYVRFEMLYRDFVTCGNDKWKDLCTAWGSSVKGLRFKILIAGGYMGQTTNAPKGDTAEQCKLIKKFVGDGMERMTSLERLELELATDDVKDEEKVEVCRELEDELREKGLEVKVVSTKKLRWWTSKNGLGVDEQPEVL